MKRTAVRVVPAIALLALGVATFVPHLKGQNTGQPSTKNGEWPMYTADLSGSKYSPLDQIGASNFSKLEVAWRFKTDNLGPRPENKLEGTPIMVKGTVFATAGTRRAVVALNGATGELKWMYSLDEGERATRWAPRQLSGRGLSYWTDGRGDERILYVTTGYRLVELNVMAQVHNLRKTTIIQRAWKKRNSPWLHAWVYDLSDGILHELEAIEPGSGWTRLGAGGGRWRRCVFARERRHRAKITERRRPPSPGSGWRQHRDFHAQRNRPPPFGGNAGHSPVRRAWRVRRTAHGGSGADRMA